MKNLMLLCIAAAIVVMAGALLLHAQTGRYQISPVTGMAGVYKVDTRNGKLEICSPMYEQGCMTLAQAHQQIAAHRENVMDTARQTGNLIDQFTRDKAQDLRRALDRLGTEGADAPGQAPAGR